MNIRILTYSAALALSGLTGCIVAPGHGGYDQGRRDERRADAARERAEDHEEARQERREEERREERYDHRCDDPYTRAHDERCR